ncbi:MAG: DUF92 domain-containing protein [Sphaerochaetaceae bacterium]
MISLYDMVIPFIVNLLLLFAALKLKLLTVSGSVASFLLGFIIFYFMNFVGWLILVFFFVSANILGKVGKLVKQVDISKIHKKGETRDWVQVFANGGIAGIAALLYGLTGSIIPLVMFGASLAASTADTWASEAGILSKENPVSILTFTPVTPGMSGGVSWLGSLSSIIGSILISSLWYVSYRIAGDFRFFLLASIIALSGIAGSLVDSYLGATVQGHYWDPVNELVTERERSDDVVFELCRGIRWIDNDIVNLMSNVVSTLLAGGLTLIVL